MKRTKVYASPISSTSVAAQQSSSNRAAPLLQRAAAGPVAKPAPRPAPAPSTALSMEARAEVNGAPDFAAAAIVPQGKSPSSGRVQLVGPGASYAPPPGHLLLCFIHRDGSAVKFAGAAGAVYVGPAEVEHEYGPLAAQARTLLAAHPATTPVAHASAPPAPTHAKTVSRAADSSATVGANTEGETSAVQRAFDTSASRPLPSETRSRLEKSFSADLGGVRVHTDSAADQAAKSVQAHAFTTGQDIYFRSSQYRPHTADGQKLIAHEVAHTVQQSGSNTGAVARQAETSSGLSISEPGDRLEREAEAASERASLGLPAPLKPANGYPAPLARRAASAEPAQATPAVAPAAPAATATTAPTKAPAGAKADAATPPAAPAGKGASA